MILQRFGHVFGTSAIFLSTPVFGILLGWAFLSGIGTLRSRGIALYMMFAGWVLVVTLVAQLYPDARFGFSFGSLAALLVTYGFTAIGPSERFDKAVIYELFLFYTRVCAVAGIVQWFAQFAGVRIFSFMVAVPPMKAVLVESQFNFNPLLHYGSSILRSNGFFLLEPSVLSQVLAIAIVLDYFVLNRTKFLPLYAFSYLLSFSGTGALSLVLAVPFYAAQSMRNFTRVALLAAVGLVALVAGSIAFPEQVGSLLSRMQELNYSGSSGYARFIGPFLPLADLSHELRILFGYGPGATERYIYFVQGTGNSIAKLVIDYGVVGLFTFLVMFLSTLWRRETAIISVLALTTFVVGGGYLLFAPMLVMLFLLCIWSGLPDDRKAGLRAA